MNDTIHLPYRRQWGQQTSEASLSQGHSLNSNNKQKTGEKIYITFELRTLHVLYMGMWM